MKTAIRLAFTAGLLLLGTVSAQQLMPPPKSCFFDANGDPLIAGKVYSYAANSSTPKVTYANAAGANNTNPVILDSTGCANVWLGTGPYKIILKDSADAVQWTVDYVSAATFGNLAGVFTNTQQNDSFYVLLNNIDPGTEYTYNYGGAQYATEAIVGGVKVPIDATVWQANGVAGYVQNFSTALPTAAVGIYGNARCMSTGTKCWGGNVVSTSVSGANSELHGFEIDINAKNAADTATALSINGAWTATPSSSNAIVVARPNAAGGTYRWGSALAISEGATSGGTAGPGIALAAVDSGTSQNSQSIRFASGDPAAGTNLVAIDETAAGEFRVTNSVAGKGIRLNSSMPTVLFADSQGGSARTYGIKNGTVAGTWYFTDETAGANILTYDNTNKWGFGESVAVASGKDLALKRGTLTLVNGANSDIVRAGSYLRITGPSAGFSVSGFTAGADGKMLILHNTTAQQMTITNDATSTAANRILTLTGADVVLRAGTSIATFIYDSAQTRWILVSTN